MNCKECGAKLQWAHEGVTGLCGMCGPGSAKHQMKEKAALGIAVPATPKEVIPNCKDVTCNNKLQFPHELETGLCYLCGPGSAKAQEKENSQAFDKFKSNSKVEVINPGVQGPVIDTKTCNVCNRIMPVQVFEHGAGNGTLCSNNFKEVEKVKET